MHNSGPGRPSSLQHYEDDIPDTLKGLVSLPGVGEKMAYLALNCAWDQNAGIGVDVHVHRISNRLNWVDSSKPEETRKQLEEWLPASLWNPINPMLVGFGQTICGSKPKCDQCAINQQCPVAFKEMGKKKTKGKKTAKKEVKEEE
eukprot:TRINITY_DN2919_c0_g1_i3.p1 TRINITY_DN2919_c0_g1~~TRINITY_DN2919_c0_g1_i3.p1  ORF type:complete len:145 (+),score=44.42 TRINITY_DN2919_c0_g1_i3:337-771(+)